MKNQIVTTGIVLSRTNYQEADRIITILTPDHGKLHAMAKGARRPKSKLAGGIELFSESELTLLPGRGELLTLASARMRRHFGNIVKDVDRTMLGYDFLKQVNRLTEDAADGEYFQLLLCGLGGLHDLSLGPNLTKLWFMLHLLDISGHAPDLMSDADGNALLSDRPYTFDYEAMSFRVAEKGRYGANHVRLLRLVRGTRSPSYLGRVRGVDEVLDGVLTIVAMMTRVTFKG